MATEEEREWKRLEEQLGNRTGAPGAPAPAPAAAGGTGTPTHGGGESERGREKEQEKEKQKTTSMPASVAQLVDLNVSAAEVTESGREGREERNSRVRRSRSRSRERYKTPHHRRERERRDGRDHGDHQRRGRGYRGDRERDGGSGGNRNRDHRHRHRHQQRDYRRRDSHPRRHHQCHSNRRDGGNHRNNHNRGGERGGRNNKTERQYANTEYVDHSYHAAQEARAQRERERKGSQRERDTRTVFASNLSTKCEERDLFEFFSKAGTVVDVRLIRDKYTRRCKGFAYVEFEAKEAVSKSLELAGQEILNQPVMVKSSEAEKNMQWEASQPTRVQQRQPVQQRQMPGEEPSSSLGTALVGNQGQPSTNDANGLEGPVKLYVGSLHINITEDDIRAIFEPFGPLDFVHLQKEPKSGRSKGYAFVQFSNSGDGNKAIAQLHGLEVVGQQIKVAIANSKGREVGAGQGSAVENMDPEGDGGLKLNAQSRAALMAKLAGGSQAASVGQVGAAAAVAPSAPAKTKSKRDRALEQPVDASIQFDQGLLGPASPIPTECILLKNMFDPAGETDEGWDKEIGEDVKLECERKFGPVSHIFVDKLSKGFTYLMFKDLEGGTMAKEALHGRWFAGRKIVCDYQFKPMYERHFGL